MAACSYISAKEMHVVYEKFYTDDGTGLPHMKQTGNLLQRIAEPFQRAWFSVCVCVCDNLPSRMTKRN